MDSINGIPALDDLDPAALVGQYSRDLRTELNDGRLPFAIASGTVTITLASQAGNSQSVTFPAGRFSTPPIVMATKQAGTLAKASVYAVGVTASGCSIGLYQGDGTSTSGSVQVGWIAIQMLPAAAEG